MKRKLFTPLLLATCISTASAFAADVPKDPKQQSSWGLYVDAQETAEMKQKLGNKMLFVDVRDPVEIMFTGFTSIVDINIPFKTANRSAWHKKKPVFEMVVNKNFEADIEAALTVRGLSKEDPIVIMCRSGGTRGAPATKLLENKGYKQVYVVTDGFEGGTLKKGEKKNWRLKNGWKNAGLPWSYKLNKDKMYFSTAKKANSMTKMEHANPMPNYMPVIMKNLDVLKVSEEQKVKLKDWVSGNNKKSAVMVKKIVMLEQEIAGASMDGNSKELLMNKFSEMLDLRKALASGKTDCRDNARSILAPEQWSKVVELEAMSRNQVEIELPARNGQQASL